MKLSHYSYQNIISRSMVGRGNQRGLQPTYEGRLRERKKHRSAIGREEHDSDIVSTYHQMRNINKYQGSEGGQIQL